MARERQITVSSLLQALEPFPLSQMQFASMQQFRLSDRQTLRRFQLHQSQLRLFVLR
jgi:hypothetical protein